MRNTQENQRRTISVESEREKERDVYLLRFGTSKNLLV